jgi:hypothetical protein
VMGSREMLNITRFMANNKNWNYSTLTPKPFQTWNTWTECYSHSEAKRK